MDNVFERAQIALAELENDAPVSGFTPSMAEAESGIERIGDTAYMRDGKGRLVPVSMIPDVDRLEDQMVRKIIDFATPLAAEVARFREHCFDDVDALISLLDAEYGVKKGGQKGNVTFMSYDGLKMVKVQIGEQVTFGPQLQQAKALIDECLKDWSDGAKQQLCVMVDYAFQVDKEGRINRGALLGLRKYKIEDARWSRAMNALNDSIRVVGKKRYVRFYWRPEVTSEWNSIVIDVAAS